MAPDLLREGPSSGDVSAEDGGGAEPPAEDRSGDARHGDILACKEETGYGRSGGQRRQSTPAVLVVRGVDPCGQGGRGGTGRESVCNNVCKCGWLGIDGSSIAGPLPAWHCCSPAFVRLPVP